MFFKIQEKPTEMSIVAIKCSIRYLEFVGLIFFKIFQNLTKATQKAYCWEASYRWKEHPISAIIIEKRDGASTHLVLFTQGCKDTNTIDGI